MKKLLAGVSAVVMALSLAGCGQTSKLYPSSKKEGVFFSVPKNWSGITTKSLNQYEAKTAENESDSKVSLVKWQIAYSPNKKIKAADVFTLQTPSHPLVFARVRALSESEINEVSYNTLRDVIIPLTQLVNGDSTQDPGFSILADEEVIEKAARGVRTVYTLTIEDVKQTISQTALVANDRSTMYIFVVRCTTTCYDKNKKTINEIVNSFTVRGAR